MTREPIPCGLHESLLTRDLHMRLAEVSGLEVATDQIDAADLPHVLAQHVFTSAQTGPCVPSLASHPFGKRLRRTGCALSSRASPL